jgi:FecR-like protein
VRITVRGAARAVQVGLVIELPAAIRTGHDGAIDLRQGNTTVAIAADSELELPATDGSIIDRLIQTRGNAFYDVGKRGARKLRVETPYLVAVIKGTQFSVAVQSDSATISLFEGRLEVRAPDDSDAVDLNAGEIAIRHAADKAIRVLRMDGAKPLATTQNDTAKRSSGAARSDGDNPLGALTPRGDGDDLVAGGNPSIRVTPSAGGDVVGIDVQAAAANATLTLEGGNGELDAGVAAKLDDAASLHVDAVVDTANGSVDAGLGAQVDLGAASADVAVDASVNLDAGTVDVDTGTAVELAGASIGAGLDAGVGLGAGAIDAGTGVAVDLGGAAAADIGADAAVDLGSAALDVGTDVAADLGAAQVDAGLDVSLEPATTAIDAGLDTSVAGTDIGLGVEVDLGSGDLGLDVGLGGLDIGLGTDSGADTSSPATTPGGLLGGLLGGRRGN